MIGMHIVQRMEPLEGSMFEVWNGLRCVARSMLVDERRAARLAVQGATSIREHAAAESWAVMRHRESVMDAACINEAVRT